MRTRKKRTQKAGVRKNLTPNAKKNLRAVLLYERSPDKLKYISGNTLPIGMRIEKLIEKQSPITEPMTVWRGQSTSIIFPYTWWFSTSLRQDVALSYTRRNVFKIHLQPGVKVLNMYEYYNKHGIKDPVKELNELQENYFQYNKNFTNDDYTQFQEVLVERGGSFWQDPEQNVKGFQFIGKVNPVGANLKEINAEGDTSFMVNMYETYYFPPTRSLI